MLHLLLMLLLLNMDDDTTVLSLRVGLVISRILVITLVFGTVAGRKEAESI